MIEIPEVSDVDVAFGNIDHMPAYTDVPDTYKHQNNDFAAVFCDLFFNGGKTTGNGGIIAGNRALNPKEGVDGAKALRAISAIMKSWEPKHEHKEAAAAFLLSEWFDLVKK